MDLDDIAEIGLIEKFNGIEDICYSYFYFNVIDKDGFKTIIKSSDFEYNENFSTMMVIKNELETRRIALINSILHKIEAENEYQREEY